MFCMGTPGHTYQVTAQVLADICHHEVHDCLWNAVLQLLPYNREVEDDETLYHLDLIVLSLCQVETGFSCSR